MKRYLDFEIDIQKIDNQINELDKKSNDFTNRRDEFLSKKNKLFESIYSKLSAWEKVQVARHADRPHSLDYINLIFS